jgi:hypothetical protein
MESRRWLQGIGLVVVQAVVLVLVRAWLEVRLHSPSAAPTATPPEVSVSSEPPTSTDELLPLSPGLVIVDPPDGSQVGRYVTLSGTGPKGAMITPSVRPLGDIVYPQPTARIGGGGRWTARIIIGPLGQISPDQQFEVWVETDAGEKSPPVFYTRR